MAAPERHDEKGYEMVSTAKGNSTGLSNSAPPSAPPSAVTSAQNSSSSFFGNDTGAALPQYQTDASPLPRKGFFGRLVDPHLHDLRSDPTVLVTSKVVTSKTLFRWRCFAAFWIFFIVPWCLARPNPETYLFYFTQLTWLGLGGYLIAAAVQTYRYNRDGNMKVFLQSWKISQWLSWNLYIMSSTFHWIVPIVFWALLSGDLIKNGNWLSWWTNVNVHAMDLVIILVEFYLNRVPIYFSQLPAILVPGLLFMGYSFFQHAVYKGYNTASYPNGWWVYSFLDVSKSGAPLYYIGLLIAFGIIFCAVIGMHRLRDRVRARKPVL